MPLATWFQLSFVFKGNYQNLDRMIHAWLNNSGIITIQKHVCFKMLIQLSSVFNGKYKYLDSMVYAQRIILRLLGKIYLVRIDIKQFEI